MIEQQYDNIVVDHQEEMKNAFVYLEQQMRQENCWFGDVLLPTFLKPAFISTQEVDDIRNVITHILNILEKVTKLYFTHPDLRDYFYIDDKAKDVIDIEHGYKKNIVIARPDSFLINHTLKFVEFNCDSPAGCGLTDALEGILLKSFPMKELQEQYAFELEHRMQCLLDALIEAYHEDVGEHKKPNIAIVDWKDVKTQGEFRIIQAYFIKQGYETIIADPRECKLSNGHLEHNGFRIDLVYRRVIFRELMGKKDEVRDFLMADRKGKITMVNPLRSRLASNKAILAIITNQKEFKDLFTDEENQIIKRHIPWTRRVLDMQTHYEDNPVFLKKHIISHQNHLVLKPADSYGGKNVTIGCETDAKFWSNLVERIIKNKEDWVVQKYVDITEMTVPVLENGRVYMVKKKYNINPFVFGHRYAGSMARLSDQSVINVSAGGGLIPAVKYQSIASEGTEK